MRKIRLKHDVNLPGYGTIKKETAFKVDRYNKRFVYVTVKENVILRLARKGDCEVVY